MTQEEKEYKERLYNQYLGQDVVILPNLVYTGNPPEPSHDEWGEADLTYDNIQKIMGHNFPLWLTSLSDITDEHAIEVAKMLAANTVWEVANPAYDSCIKALYSRDYELCHLYNDLSFGAYDSDINFEGNYLHLPKVIDFLRKNGYALPYDGISVEEQINRGYIKLKES